MLDEPPVLEPVLEVVVLELVVLEPVVLEPVVLEPVVDDVEEEEDVPPPVASHTSPLTTGISALSFPLEPWKPNSMDWPGGILEFHAN